MFNRRRTDETDTMSRDEAAQYLIRTGMHSSIAYATLVAAINPKGRIQEFHAGKLYRVTWRKDRYGVSIDSDVKGHEYGTSQARDRRCAEPTGVRGSRPCFAPSQWQCFTCRRPMCHEHAKMHVGSNGTFVGHRDS